jgi:hypothetical protein
MCKPVGYFLDCRYTDPKGPKKRGWNVWWMIYDNCKNRDIVAGW